MPKKPQNITDAELVVMKVLWDSGPMTAKAITQAIYPDCLDSEFAAVHSFLYRLEKKCLVKRDRSAFVHVFAAAASQGEVAGQELEALADRLSDGSMAPFITHLVQRKRLSKKDADEIRRILKKHFG